MSPKVMQLASDHHPSLNTHLSPQAFTPLPYRRNENLPLATARATGIAPQQLGCIYTQTHTLQRSLAQDDERTPKAKPRRASDDADDGLSSIVVRCCRAGLKQEHWHYCENNNSKSYIVLHCSGGGVKERCKTI